MSGIFNSFICQLNKGEKKQKTKQKTEYIDLRVFSLQHELPKAADRSFTPESSKLSILRSSSVRLDDL